MATTNDALTGDPLVSFNFEVKIEGKLSGYFTECSGLGSESEVTEHKIVGQGDREAVRKIPGRLKWGDITLKRGITANMDGTARANGSIIMYDQAGTAVAQWDFSAGWPSKVTGPSVQADSSAVGVEEMVIVHEGIKRLT